MDKQNIRQAIYKVFRMYRLSTTKRGIRKGFLEARGREPTSEEIIYYKRMNKKSNKNR